MCDECGIRKCHSLNHILESSGMNEREGRMRFILRIHERNDCFGREMEVECVVLGKRE